ncbi:protein of unknown function [Hyphomicrobium sp. 1Nfss2.1]|uniref:hypothetical protein n=1 Tax=Hyphomicrobium sp. 1Nfss2.1 TaxID=3413936 RepID=UPI003C7ED452
MSNVTNRLLPHFLRQWLQRAEITDGAAELTATYQIHEILKKLPAESQRRALQHVADILEENASQQARFAAALEAQDQADKRRTA